MNQTENRSNKKKIVISVVVLVVLIVGMISLYMAFQEKPMEGRKAFTVEVVDDQGESTFYEGHTDAEYLKQALEELQDLSIESDEGAFGPYVKIINGVTADYEKNGAYWSFYLNDEYCNYGVEEQPVHEGDAFKIVYEG